MEYKYYSAKFMYAFYMHHLVLKLLIERHISISLTLDDYGVHDNKTSWYPTYDLATMVERGSEQSQPEVGAH